MASGIRGSSTADRLIQSELQATPSWTDALGLEGDDYIGWLAGNVDGGAGNDRIENLNPANRSGVGAAYWSSPRGILADLTKQYVDDGWGGRDTLINVYKVCGSNYQDTLYGSDGDDWFDQSAGDDLIDAGAGTDVYWVSDRSLDFRVTLSPDTGVGRVTWRYDWSPQTVQSANLKGVETIFFQGNDKVPEKFVALSALIDWAPFVKKALTISEQARWNVNLPLGSATQITYQFVEQQPADYSGSEIQGFDKLTSAAKQVVRSVLNDIESFTLIDFVEVTDSSKSAQIRIGVSQQADTRGYAFAPLAGYGEKAGDVWLDVETARALGSTQESKWVLMHEVGHALGLNDTGLRYAAMPELQFVDRYDDMRFTLMSSKSIIPDLYPLNFARFDLSVLRDLYGSRPVVFPKNARQEPTFVFDDVNTQGFLTVYTDQPGITLDASSIAVGVTIYANDSNQASSVGISPNGELLIGNVLFSDTNNISAVTGTVTDDVFIGNDQNNRFDGMGGNDLFDGSGGVDRAVFSMTSQDAIIKNDYGYVQISRKEQSTGNTSLVRVEEVQFIDKLFRIGTDAADTLGGGVGGAQYLAFDGDDRFNGRIGNDTFEGGLGRDVVVYEQASSAYRLKLLGEGRATIAKAGVAPGDSVNASGGALHDELIGVERIAFADKTISIERKAHGSYGDLPDALYAFFVVGFAAVPGVVYMDQMADAYRYWLPGTSVGAQASQQAVGDTVQRIVEVFTSKPQFTGVYPQALYRQEAGAYWRYEHDSRVGGSPLVKVESVSAAAYETQMELLAKGLVDRIVKGSASELTKQAAVGDVKAALLLGGDWTIGKVIYTVFGNLAAKPTSDVQWGGTAKQFANQVAVAKYYTDTLGLSSEDIASLRAVIEPVTHSSDLSSTDDIATLIGSVLLQVPGI